MWQGGFAFYNSSLSESAVDRVYGNGTQTRSFCHIADTSIGLLLLLTSKGTKGEVGNPEEVTILKMAQRIKQLTGSASPIMFHPLPEDDPRRRCPDISREEKLPG